MSWEKVDHYLDERLGNEPAWLAEARAANRDAGLRDIAVSPQHGAFLSLLVRLCGAKRILEVGTLGGYSTLWMAYGADAESRIVTLEVSADNAAQARRNFDASDFGDQISLIEGDANETLTKLDGPFDFTFIDADKKSNPAYLSAAIELSRPGSLIAIDNVVREGRIIDPTKTDPNINGARDVIAAAGAEDRLSTAGLQTVGSKGWDGLLLCLVKP